MNRSWFYLTLWRGTPPEFTSEFGMQIQTSDPTSAQIKMTDVAQQGIDTLTKFATQIKGHDPIDVDITTAAEVTWYVN